MRSGFSTGLPSSNRGRLTPGDGLGLIAHRRKNLPQAKAFFDKALALNPNSATYHLRLGVVHRAQGHSDKAVESYEKALKLDAKIPGLHGNMGNALRDLKRYKEAIAAYRKGLAENPKSPTTLVNLALGLSSDKQYEEAAQHLQTAIDLEPKNANTRKELGNVLLELQRYDDALASYRKAIEINPEDHTAYHNLATALQNIGRLEESAEAYRQALKIRPDFFGSLRQFASVKKFKDGDEEIAAIEQGLQSENIPDEERIDLYFALAKAYDDTGAHDKAFPSAAIRQSVVPPNLGLSSGQEPAVHRPYYFGLRQAVFRGARRLRKQFQATDLHRRYAALGYHLDRANHCQPSRRVRCR